MNWARFKQSWRETSNWNKLLVCLTATIAVSNLFYVHYARKQFETMGGQLQTAMKQVETTRMSITTLQRLEGAYIGVGQPHGAIASNEIGIPLENYGRIPSPRVWIYPHVSRFAANQTTQPQVLYSHDYTTGGDDTEITP